MSIWTIWNRFKRSSLLAAAIGVATLVAVVVSSVLAATAVAAPTLEPGGQFTFLTPGEESSESGLSGIASAPTGGDVWVTGAALQRVGTTPETAGFQQTYPIRRFSSSGALVASFAGPQGRRILDLGVSPDGAVLYAPAVMVGTGYLGVLRIDAASGAVLGSFAAPGSGPGAVDQAFAVSVDPIGGKVYVPVVGSTRLKRYSADGAFEADVMLSAQQAAGFSGTLVVDPRNGDLLVLDVDASNNYAVDRYRASGEFLKSVSVVSGSEIAVRPQDGAIYVAGEDDLLSVYTAAGGFVRSQPLPRSLFTKLSVRPDGTRLWSLVYNSEINYFLTGEDSSPSPAPPTDPPATSQGGAAPPPPPPPTPMPLTPPIAPVVNPIGGGVTPPPARGKGKLSAQVTKADLRAPFKFTTSGRLTLPSGVAKSAGCTGRVSAQVKRGSATISTRRVALRTDCTYSVRVSFANARRFASVKQLKFIARFAGNRLVSPTVAPARFARVRR